MSISETFHGYVETTQDSLLVFEACRRNILPEISRRLQERERKLVRSGSVFVYDERDSGIKRWTDGLIWSPSRILGNFLIYRELDKKRSSNNQQKDPSSSSTRKSAKNNNNVDNSGRKKIRQRSNSSNSNATAVGETFDQTTYQRTRERQLVGSLSESFNFKPNGLIKKTMSLVVQGAPIHLVSYYHPDDVLERQLRTPSAVPELANLEISPELLSRQNFRIPPVVEPADYNNSITSPTPTQSTSNTPLPHSPQPVLSHHHHYSLSTPPANTRNQIMLDYYSNGNIINSLLNSSQNYHDNGNSIQIPSIIHEE